MLKRAPERSGDPQWPDSAKSPKNTPEAKVLLNPQNWVSGFCSTVKHFHSHTEQNNGRKARLRQLLSADHDWSVLDFGLQGLMDYRTTEKLKLRKEKWVTTHVQGLDMEHNFWFLYHVYSILLLQNNSKTRNILQHLEKYVVQNTTDHFTSYSIIYKKTCKCSLKWWKTLLQMMPNQTIPITVPIFFCGLIYHPLTCFFTHVLLVCLGKCVVLLYALFVSF